MRSDTGPFDNFIFRCQIANSLPVQSNINHYGTEKILDGVSGRSESSQIQTRHLRKCAERSKASHTGHDVEAYILETIQTVKLDLFKIEDTIKPAPGEDGDLPF